MNKITITKSMGHILERERGSLTNKLRVDSRSVKLTAYFVTKANNIFDSIKLNIKTLNLFFYRDKELYHHLLQLLFHL